ncbi:hypothetical protein HPK19_20965 [Arthrobacter citreus]|nr:hypothetical protein HPK19_20965 [Arthrobacter citreus]
MRNEEFNDHHKEGKDRGDGSRRKEHHRNGAKTFRRRRAIGFLEMMNIKRSTLMQQLNAPEFQSIHQIIVGELKAIDMVINEFVKVFEIHESELVEKSESTNETDETTALDSSESIGNDEK